jgi:16S rRNA (uracil1498-N3)-methyltransferase
VPSNRAVAHVFVEDLDQLELNEEDDHHLRRVLRITPGERVTASDGRGRWRSCRLGPSGLEYEGISGSDDPPAPRVTVAFALTKGDKPEWVVQKLTEAGVDSIQPFVAARSVVRWDDKKIGRAHV